MSSYIVLGTNDLDKADNFYKTVFKNTSLKEITRYPHIIIYDLDGFKFGIVKPRNGSPATYGNGTMLALELGSMEKVEEVLKLALANGGKIDGVISEGRNDDGSLRFYGQYWRDLDNNRICLTHNTFK